LNTVSFLEVDRFALRIGVEEVGFRTERRVDDPLVHVPDVKAATGSFDPRCPGGIFAHEEVPLTALESLAGIGGGIEITGGGAVAVGRVSVVKIGDVVGVQIAREREDTVAIGIL